MDLQLLVWTSLQTGTLRVDTVGGILYLICVSQLSYDSLSVVIRLLAQPSKLAYVRLLDAEVIACTP